MEKIFVNYYYKFMCNNLFRMKSIIKGIKFANFIVS